MAILQSMTAAVQKNKTAKQPTMADNVASILDRNSLLMQSAAAKGERFAAARGLQNSTVGAEAAQRAIVDAAIPIAQVDTQNQFTAQQAGLEREHQRGLTQLQADLNYKNQSRLNQAQNQFVAQQAGLDREHQKGLTKLQSDLSFNNQSRLNDMQNKFAASQAALDRTHQLDLTRLRGELDHQNQMSLASIQHQNQMAQLNAQVAANTIGKSIDFLQQITHNYDAQIGSLLQNTNLNEEGKRKAITQLKASRDSEVEFVTTFFNHIPTTRQSWSSFPNLGVPQVKFK